MKCFFKHSIFTNCKNSSHNTMLLVTEDKRTGLVIIRIIAFGQYFPQAWTRSRTIEAFVLNKSSRVIPVNSNSTFKMTT